jgi:hypothetical protein
MNIQITVSPDVYRGASAYAAEHNTSVKEILVSYLEKLRPSRSDDADKKLQELIGLTKGFHLDANDLNGDKAKSRFMKEKFIKG